MEQKSGCSDSVEAHILNRFTLLEKLGSGAYGHVWKVQHNKTGTIYALKKVFDAFQNSTDAQRTFREVAVLRQLKHDNIVKLIDVIKAESNLDIYLLFEYFESDLHCVIMDDLLQNAHRKAVIYQIAKALLYLHSGQIIHRDLKPSNVLINEDCQIKICDFGLVKFLKSLGHDHHILTEHVATRWYRSPEMLLGSKNYSKPTDMWSLGCILAEMILKKPLFPGKSNLDQIQRVLNFTGLPTTRQLEALDCDQAEVLISQVEINLVNKAQLFRSCDSQLAQIIFKLLKLNPLQRMTVEQLIEHPYLSQFRMPETEVVCSEPFLCPVNDNNKLSVKEYRNLIYEPIRKYDQKKLREIPSFLNERPRRPLGRSMEKRSIESKSDWSSPYLKENRALRPSPYRKKLLQDTDKHCNNTVHVKHDKKPDVLTPPIQSYLAYQGSSIPSKHVIRRRRLRREDFKE